MLTAEEDSVGEDAPDAPAPAVNQTDSQKCGGVLYVVATPIGNLEDITARALRVLREVRLIAAEDTRVTRKLLAHFDIHTPLVSYHAHSGAGRESGLVERLMRGDSVALVSDAGTPAISDPGAELVAAAIDAGIRVEPIPGASAVISALVASGLPTDRFVFEGFLPRNNADQRERLLILAREPRTTLLYEAPSRLVDTLKSLARAFGDNRRVCVGREITKKFEEFRRGTLAEVAAHYAATPPRGECVIVLEGASGEQQMGEADDTPDTDALLRAALDRGLSPRDAAREVAKATNGARNTLYARVLALRDEAA